MRTRSLVLLGAVLALAPAPAASAADDSAALGALVERQAPAVVSVKFVLKTEDGSELPGTATGAMVDPSGLLLLAEAHFADGAPRGLKLLYGSDPTEHDAVLVAKDTTLGLAFLQALDAGEKPLPAIDLAKAATVKVGSVLWGITRSERGFDYAPQVQRCYASAKVEKPRPMWALGGDFTTDGLPAFDLQGNVAGVVSTQGVADEDDASSHMTCLLPMDTVAKSVAAAKKRVPDALAKAKEAASKEEPAAGMAGEPPAMGETPPEPPKPPEQPK
jgi:hypothetical protein